jgi:hypothetical protein
MNLFFFSLCPAAWVKAHPQAFPRNPGIRQKKKIEPSTRSGGLLVPRCAEIKQAQNCPLRDLFYGKHSITLWVYTLSTTALIDGQLIINKDYAHLLHITK